MTEPTDRPAVQVGRRQVAGGYLRGMNIGHRLPPDPARWTPPATGPSTVDTACHRLDPARWTPPTTGPSTVDTACHRLDPARWTPPTTGPSTVDTAYHRTQHGGHRLPPDPARWTPPVTGRTQHGGHRLPTTEPSTAVTGTDTRQIRSRSGNTSISGISRPGGEGVRRHSPGADRRHPRRRLFWAHTPRHGDNTRALSRCPNK